MTEEAIPLDTLARVYRKIRDRVQLLTKEFDSQVEELKAQQNEIKIAMVKITATLRNPRRTRPSNCL